MKNHFKIMGICILFIALFMPFGIAQGDGIMPSEVIGKDIIDTHIENGIRVDWYEIQNGLTYKEYIFSIHKLDGSPSKHKLEPFIDHADPSIYEITGFNTLEFTEKSREVEEYETVCEDVIINNENGTLTTKECERIIKGTYTEYYWTWDDTNVKPNYERTWVNWITLGLMDKQKTKLKQNIDKKTISTEKKWFKISFNVPIRHNDKDNTFGNLGRYGVMVDGVIYHPWWDASWKYRFVYQKNSTTNVNMTLKPVEEYMDVSGFSQKPYHDSIRLVDGYGNEIISSVINKSLDGNFLNSFALLYVYNWTSYENHTFYVYYSNESKGDTGYQGIQVNVDGSNEQIQINSSYYTIRYNQTKGINYGIQNLSVNINNHNSFWKPSSTSSTTGMTFGDIRAGGESLPSSIYIAEENPIRTIIHLNTSIRNETITCYNSRYCTMNMINMGSQTEFRWLKYGNSNPKVFYYQGGDNITISDQVFNTNSFSALGVINYDNDISEHIGYGLMIVNETTLSMDGTIRTSGGLNWFCDGSNCKQNNKWLAHYVFGVNTTWYKVNETIETLKYTFPSESGSISSPELIPPSHTTPILNTTLRLNTTHENLTCWNQSTDGYGYDVKNIYSWYLQNQTIEVLNMPFETGSNATYTKDYSSYGRDGSEFTGGTNVIYNATGGYDGFGAYEFIETGSISVLPQVPYSDEVTFAFWFRPRSVGNMNHLFRSGLAGGYVRILSSNRLNYRWYNSTTYVSCASDIMDIEVGKWEHLTVTASNITGEINLYRNGVLINTPTGNCNITEMAGLDPTYNLTIALGYGATAISNFTIDDVKIYDKVLSTEQIKFLFENKSHFISSAETNYDDVYICGVTPISSVGAGETLNSTSLRISQIAPPIINNVTIHPNVTNVYYGTTVNCSTNIIEYSGESTLNFVWYKDGVMNNILNSTVSPALDGTYFSAYNLTLHYQDIGSNYTCGVILNDKYNLIQYANSTTVYINKSFWDIEIYPSEIINTTDDINVSAQFLTEDSSRLFTIIIRWFKNGAVVLTNTYNNIVNGTYVSSVLDSSYFSKGDNITAQMVVDETGETLNATTLFIHNLPPTTPTIMLPPNNTNTMQDYMDIKCGGSTDPDGDTIYYEIWNITSSGASILQNTTSMDYKWEGLINGTYYWRCRAFDGNLSNGYSENTSTFQFNVLNITVSACNIGSANTTLNVTLWNETTNTLLNGTMHGNIVYYLSDDYYGVEGNKTLNYNIGNNHTFTFCFNPFISLNLTANATFNFNSEGYPGRKAEISYTLSNTTINHQKLYLLHSSDGIYTTFMVVNNAGQAIKNVLVKVEKHVGGIITTIEEKYTDDAGSATFWVDYTQPHTFTFTKSGYETYSTTLTPTQPSYTVTLSTTHEEDETVHYTRGITYSIYPTNHTLNNNTNYNFTFDISSSYWELDEAGFVIANNSNYIMGHANCSGGLGCMASLISNTEGNNYILMKYFWRINDSYMNGTHTWYVTEIYEGEYSLLALTKGDFENLGAGFSNFTKAMITLIIILMVIVGLTYTSGAFSPLAITWLIFGLMLLLEYLKIAPTVIGAVPFFNSIVLGLIAISYTIWEYRW